MTFEHISQNSLVATLTADDMSCCNIEFSTMSMADSATRALLCDMLSLMEHMGLRHYGDRVTVECSAGADGGCRLVFTIQAAARWRFDSCDDVLAADAAGAMPALPYSLVPDSGGFILIPLAGLSDSEALRLSEFCLPPAP